MRFSSHTLLAQHRKTCSPRRLFVCQVCKIVFNKEADIVNHKMALHRCEEVAMFSDIYLVMMVDFTQNVKERRDARKRQISRHKERKMAEEMRAFVPGGGFPRPRISIVQELAGKDGYSAFSSTVNDAFGIEELGLGGVAGVEPQDSYAHDLGMFDYSDHEDDDVNDHDVGDADDVEATQEGGKPQIYECDACTIMFASKKAYTKHLAGHMNEEQFICEGCRTVFREEEEFNRHKLECSQFLRQQEVAPDVAPPVQDMEPELLAPPPPAPPEEEMPPHLAALRADSPPPPPSPSRDKPSGPGAIFRCAVCKEMFSNDWALFEHLEMHPAKKRRYPCDQCGKIFLCSTKIIVHKNIVHRSREQCENCGRVYENKKDRRAHVLTCVLNETHKCTECDVTCRTRVSLYFHMRTHINREITQCGTCGQKFNRKSRLKWHVQTVHQNAWAFKCDICDQRFRYKKGLISHLSAQHNQGDRKFECDVCGDKFIFQYRLKRHKLRHLRSREIILPFKCDKCDKSFSEKRYLDNHKIRIHLHKPFKCPDCSRAFLLQQNLDDHLRTEHTHRPFRCEVCALCFTNKNRLQVRAKSYSHQTKVGAKAKKMRE